MTRTGHAVSRSGRSPGRRCRGAAATSPVRLADGDVPARRAQRARAPRACREGRPRRTSRRGRARRPMPRGSSGNACASASTISTRSASPRRGDAPVRRLDELGRPLDADDAAAERRGEQQRRSALAAGQVEHARLGAEAEVVPEQRDLLRARRVLDLVVALGDGEVPGHARRLRCARRRATALLTRLRAGRTSRACSSSDASARASFATFRASLRR